MILVHTAVSCSPQHQPPVFLPLRRHMHARVWLLTWLFSVSLIGWRWPVTELIASSMIHSCDASWSTTNRQQDGKRTAWRCNTFDFRNRTREKIRFFTQAVAGCCTPMSCLMEIERWKLNFRREDILYFCCRMRILLQLSGRHDPFWRPLLVLQSIKTINKSKSYLSIKEDLQKKQTDAKFTTPAAKMQLKQSVSDLTSLEGKKVLIRYVPMVLSCAFVFDSTAAAAVSVECFYFFSPTRRKKPRVIFIDFCRTHKHAFVNKMGLSPYETERRQRLAFFNFFNLNTFIGTQNCQHNKNTASILTYHWKMVSLRMIIGSVRRCQPWRRFWIKVHLQSWWVI